MMNRGLTAVVAAASILSSSSAADAKRDITYLDKFTMSGEVENCINTRRIKESLILDDSTIVFHMRGDSSYVNRLDQRCGGLRMKDSFSFSNGINRLCNTDTVWGQNKPCLLGMFERIEKKPAD